MNLTETLQIKPLSKYQVKQLNHLKTQGCSLEEFLSESFINQQQQLIISNDFNNDWLYKGSLTSVTRHKFWESTQLAKVTGWKMSGSVIKIWVKGGHF